LFASAHLRQFFAVAAVAALGGTLDAAPPGHGTKLDQELRSATGEVQVIVRARPGLQASVRERLRGRGAVLNDLALVDAVTARIRADRLAELDLDSNIETISLDVPMIDTAASGTQGDPDPLPGTQLAASLGLPVQGANGRGVGVAFIDSGLAPNADFADVDFFDFTTPAGRHPYDDYGHGTHLSGLVASKGVLSQTSDGALYKGLAPKAHLIILKVLDERGIAMTSTVIEALQFAIMHKSALGIDVINLSLGHPILEPAKTDPLVRAVEAASDAGIVVVVAAGNVGQSPKTGRVGYAGILSPGNAESAITVGALDTRNSVTHGDDKIPAYSSRGPTFYDGEAKPDVVAPGQNLVSDAALGSTLYLEHPSNQVSVGNSRFLCLSGTSIAAAVTSGVAALVIQASRQDDGTQASPKLVKEILSYTATPLSGYDALTQGHGALNAAGAIAVAKALSDLNAPKWWKALPLDRFTVVAGEAWMWANSAVFPNDLVTVWANSIDWSTADGDTIVWGTAMGLDGDTIVWGTAMSLDGDTIVWGTTADGDTIVWGTTVDLDTAMLWGTSLRIQLAGVQ
jgi:subtilisin family serine protease